ncbi:MAG TPA: ATP-binding protein [Gemmatimonadaceae bacterium]|nr:ATP-binding protein [Gemmatimonadaceae bacterium]
MRASRVRPAVLAAAALAICTLGMVAVRPMLKEVHVALILLLVVLGASAAGGRMLGLATAAASFIVFDVLFLPPYNTLVVANPLDWIVLIAFLITSAVAAQLLYRAQEEARTAHERAEEIDRLATLGAETLNAAHATDALEAIAGVIRSSIDVDTCEILMRGLTGFTVAAGSGRDARGVSQSSHRMAEWVNQHGVAVIDRRDGTTHLDAARPSSSELGLLEDGRGLALLLPLRVRDRPVGVLRVANAAGIRLDPERWRFLDAISYYAALGVERMRLAAEAEHAEALREADRLKDALLASVSHDLRTPLTTIKAMAHDLSALGDERSEIIEQEADRLNRFVADLLDLSRLNAGALPVRLELNAVDDLLGALVQRVEGSLGAKRIVVTLPPGDALLFGRFDFVQALRALANLVENAKKYDRSEAPIEVTAERVSGEIAIRVSDRGPGVPAEAVPRLFEPFQRPNGSQPDAGGAGLGLSIARRVAEAQNGRLIYEPRAGGGSEFTLYLPALDEGSLVTRG